jgi:glycosyltransferase involved in cell wall biosynthesis
MHCKSDILILCVKPTERTGHVGNKEFSGIYENIEFFYPGKSTIISSWFIVRRIQNFAGFLNTLRVLHHRNKSKKIDSIIVYLNSPIKEFALYLYTCYLKVKLVKEESENPDVYFQKKGLFNILIKKYYLKFNYRLYDGLLLMTQRLIQLIVKEGKVGAPYLHVPMTVDIKRFEDITSDFPDDSYVAYCGILNDEKDGVNLLLKAFANISSDFPLLKLFLIGNAESENKIKEYNRIIEEGAISKRVLFYGNVSREEIPSLLCKAKLLVLPRPLSKQAEYGFPTKLAEYLATGVPVVTTKVGEIPQYLHDRHDSFLAEPGSVDSLALKMNEALSDYQRAVEIGKRGKTVASNSFNYMQRASEIIEFIKMINTCVV